MDKYGGSNEDFEYIFGSRNIDEAYDQVSRYCKTMIYTKNTEGVDVISDGKKYHFPVKKIQPVSTIGAGDNFNAGTIAALYRLGIHASNLTELRENQWGEIINDAVNFASDVCMSYENYVSTAFASEYKSSKL